MSAAGDTSFWHPFAEMGSVRAAEYVIERGEDVWVWDQQGHRLLDGTASLWYANVGHGRREIAEAVTRQMAEIEAYSCFGDYATPPALELCDRLASLSGLPGAKVFLGSGGGDAIDTAAKLARRYWHLAGQPERELLISRTAGYHGTHGYGTALGGIPANRDGLGELVPDTALVPHDSAASLAEQIERLGAERVAAFFIEPVIGAGGVYPPPAGYVEAVAGICAEAGVLLVVDAVICAFGRLGNWFGIERWPEVTPDMICFAKGVTSGYLPLGGVVVAERVAEPFWREGAPAFRHGPTYAGHAACAAAALANLEILEREQLLPRGGELEGALLGALGPLRSHELVAEVRGGVGTLAAVELEVQALAEDPRLVAKAAAAAREHGVLVRPLGRALAASPPLTATPEHFAMIGEAIGQALDTVQGTRPAFRGAPA
jgi:putrescine---pyruvate transaminase